MKDKAFLFLSTVFLVIIGCAHEWQDPNTSVPARQVDIDVILSYPIIFDSAGVIVEGKVWDLIFDRLEEDDKQIPYTEFKLADRDGNFINVFVRGYAPIVEGDFVKVLGIYRRELSKEHHAFTNELEAIKLEKVEK